MILEEIISRTAAPVIKLYFDDKCANSWWHGVVRPFLLTVLKKKKKTLTILVSRVENIN